MAYHDMNGRIMIDEAAAQADIRQERQAVQILRRAARALRAVQNEANDFQGETASAIAKIKVNADSLRDNASQITQQIQQLELLNNRLDTLLKQIEGSWTGNASAQYLETMRQHKLKAQAMVRVLETFRDYMQKAASQFENVDHNGATRIRNC